MPSALTTSASGRICLFGEHQDYLGLPVIAAAISRRISITGAYRSDNQVVINLPDIGQRESFELLPVIPYTSLRDYFKSAINVLIREGFQFTRGIEVTVHGNIPINSGTSSSSALLVAWINWLTSMADVPVAKTRAEIGELAYRAEVLEFGEPGGMMDHYSTSVGEVIYLESQPTIRLEVFEPRLGTFVLGDSRQPKDTLGVLKHVKFGMLAAIDKIKKTNPSFSLHTFPSENAVDFKDILSSSEYALLNGNLSDRDVLKEALKMFREDEIDHHRFGELLTIHQESLRDAKKVSTDKIDGMIDAALNAGAYGAKINGSGGGGCMFAYAPENPEAVAQAIEKAGGLAYLIKIDEGTKHETIEKISLKSF
ncbi:GHMP family kinase ATP-binding protein [Dyadobacter pollutisoli]|uniref:GHMP kinase n=1 Tax=Dyadobacter pollutisoli TaxID=2910158 RepID=A0A9E8NBD5_9BACT|nr:galactokinase family protein [Dyadobacter pollutisoli]WAC13525.1 GHMP kinase [Dyadobacter pollutisoli]